MINAAPKLGARIKQLRKTAGLSQPAFAIKIGTSPRQLARFEKDEATPHAGIIAAISELCNYNFAHELAHWPELLTKDAGAQMAFDKLMIVTANIEQTINERLPSDLPRTIDDLAATVLALRKWLLRSHATTPPAFESTADAARAFDKDVKQFRRALQGANNKDTHEHASK